MRHALDNQAVTPFRTPPEVRIVRVDLDTGRPADIGSRNVILEAFQVGTEPGPTTRNVFLDNGQDVDEAVVVPTALPGGREAPVSDYSVQQGIY